jgi:hypothetical protein
VLDGPHEANTYGPCPIAIPYRPITTDRSSIIRFTPRRIFPIGTPPLFGDPSGNDTATVGLDPERSGKLYGTTTADSNSSNALCRRSLAAKCEPLGCVSCAWTLSYQHARSTVGVCPLLISRIGKLYPCPSMKDHMYRQEFPVISGVESLHPYAGILLGW